MNEEKTHVMTEEEIVAAPETDYMNEAQIAFLKTDCLIFMNRRVQIFLNHTQQESYNIGWWHGERGHGGL